MIKASNISIGYDQKGIVKGLSLEVGKGETLAIIGPSGCGKSTLLLALADLLPIQEGDIQYGSQDIGLILQNHGLFPWKTIRANIALGLKSRKYPKEQIESALLSIARELKIEHILDKYPGRVSGGERQRAAMARILVVNPKILLMDEPSSALDALNKTNFQALLLKLQKEKQIASIIVTHDIQEAVFLGKRIGVMIGGVLQKIIDNPCYGTDIPKKSPAFFEMCVKLEEELTCVGGYDYE